MAPPVVTTFRQTSRSLVQLIVSVVTIRLVAYHISEFRLLFLAILGWKRLRKHVSMAAGFCHRLRSSAPTTELFKVSIYASEAAFKMGRNAVFALRIALAVTGAFAGACSSGGGGSGATAPSGNGGNDAVLSLTPASIDHQATVAGSAQILTVSVTANKQLTKSTLYVGADADTNVFRSITFFDNGDSVGTQIETHETLWGGTYSGNITLYFCADVLCKSHLANSPLTLPYKIVIPNADNRMEPINFDDEVVPDYDRNFIIINTASNSPVVSVRYRTEFSPSAGDLILPEAMKADFGVADISPQGFTLNAMPREDGIHTFNYELSFTASEFTITFTIYQIVGRAGGAKDQFIFFEDPIVVNALYGSPNNHHNTYYIISGENRKILDYKDFFVDYYDGIDWAMLTSQNPGQLSLHLKTQNLPLGTYTARIDASTYHTKINSSVDLIVNVVDGFDLRNDFSTVRFNSFFPWSPREVHVDNSQQAEGAWRASTNVDWIELIETEGKFATPEERQNSEWKSTLHYRFDPSAVAALPNNSRGVGIITFTCDDPRFPDASVEIAYEKAYPQITYISMAEVEAGKPFTLTAQGVLLREVIHGGVGLRSGDDTFLSHGLFSINEASLTDSTMQLSHPGVPEPGEYEIVFNHGANPSLSLQVPPVPNMVLKVIPALNP